MDIIEAIDKATPIPNIALDTAVFILKRYPVRY
jgi:hypothetical protein